jgi:ligand-binding sensor domain-containing protein/DNA-binding CsgD family transcriptional regulator
MKPFVTILLLLLLATENLSAQNSLGLPEIKNFNKQDYLAGTQNWDIEQDEQGIIYFANNEGVLTFDGSYWRLYPTPNKTVVRSIQIDGHRIYVGAQNEIGYFSPDQQGAMVYTSLLPLLPEKERAFSDVWNIALHDGSVFFQANNKIIQVKGQQVSCYHNHDWKFLGKGGNRLFAQDSNHQLLEWNGKGWTAALAQQTLSTDLLVTGILPYNQDTLMVTSFKQGVFLFAGNKLSALQTPMLQHIAAKNIYRSIPVAHNQILLATSLGGCFIIDKKGGLVQSFSLAEGLQNNNIRYAFLDKSRNLWLGLDNGIDFLTYDNAIKHIYTDRKNEGGGYAARIHNNKLYLGTSNGLYYTPLGGAKNLSLLNGPVTPIPGTEGQVWNLSEVGGQLLMGHHEGAFVIDGQTATPFDRSSGFWNFFTLSNAPVPLVLAGTYYGVSFYQAQNNRLTRTGHNINFESARIVALNNGDIWVAHPYKGIFKVSYKNGQPAYTAYAGKGISSRSHYYVYQIRNKTVVPTERGFFEYNAATDRFEPSALLQKLFGAIRVNYMKEDSEGNIWFTSEKSLGVLDFSGPKPQIIYIPELNGQMVSGFDFVYPINKNNVLVGGEQGFYNINYEQYRNNNYKLAVLIRTVEPIAANRSIFGGYYGPDEKTNYTRSTVPELAFKWNSLRFEFSSPFFGQQANIEYSYRLEGFDQAWSGWAKKTEKEYTNLPPGTYVFSVKARNNLGNESPVATYTFTILAPWYRSPLAYFLYVLLALAAGYLLYKRQKQKFAQQRIKYEEEQKRLQYLHQLEIERNEQAIVRLKNEKLESEISHKNKELAAATMHLVQKGELMGKIREELLRSLKNIGHDDSSKDFKKIIKMMTEDEKFEQDWEHFAFHFDRVHGDFLMLLKEKFPQLTASELKLCAYLRMNLSTKEMAQLMNITVRGVEVSRYRLRKKLHIPTEANLFDYLTEAVKEGKTVG